MVMVLNPMIAVFEKVIVMLGFLVSGGVEWSFGRDDLRRKDFSSLMPFSY
jgi:hypothetical protein